MGIERKVINSIEFERMRASGYKFGNGLWNFKMEGWQYGGIIGQPCYFVPVPRPNLTSAGESLDRMVKDQQRKEFYRMMGV